MFPMEPADQGAPQASVQIRSEVWIPGLTSDPLKDQCLLKPEAPCNHVPMLCQDKSPIPSESPFLSPSISRGPNPFPS